MSLTIRRANALDIEATVALDDYVRIDPRRADQIERWLTRDESYVAELDGAIAGYGALNYDFFDQGQVAILAVAESHRRKGIGRALLRHMIAACRTEKLWYTTNLTNQPAQAMLAAEGFRLSGLIEGLDEGDPELIYHSVCDNG